MTRRSSLLLPALALAVACSATAPTPRTTTFTFERAENIGVYVVDRVVLSVDGKVVFNQNEGPAELALGRFALRPGHHRVGAMVTVSYEAPGGRCLVDVASTKVLEVGEDAATVTWSLRLASMASADFAAGARLDATAKAGALAELDPEELQRIQKAGISSQCFGGEPVPLIRCRTAEMLDRARKERDVVKVTCLADKVTELENLERRLGEVGPEPTAKGPLEERAVMIEIEASQCAPNTDTTFAENIFAGTRVRCPGQEPTFLGQPPSVLATAPLPTATATATAPPPEPAFDAAETFRVSCAGCHDESGRGLGPSLTQLPGRKTKLQDGSTLRVDWAYFDESLRFPDRKIVAGYAPQMPAFGSLTPAQSRALFEYTDSGAGP